MSLVFFGTGEFAVPALKRLAKHVELVVTQPDRPKGRGKQLQASPIKQVALELGLPVETPERARAPEFVQRVANLRPKALIVASYGQILSQALLDTAVRGGINLHASLLPKYRGAAPIQRAILNGDFETGVVLMQMDKGMDTGDVIEMTRVAIDPDETYGELQERLAEIAASQIEMSLPSIEAGQYQCTPQDSQAATMAPKIEKSEAQLDFFKPAPVEYNRFRAFTPNPGAYLRTQRGAIRISKARLGDQIGEPGTVLASRDSLEIGFAAGSLKLLELQPEGKKRISGRELMNGWRLKPGDSIV